MPKISSTDASIHSTQYLICALHNPEPASALVKPVNFHKESVISLAEIFIKSNPPPNSNSEGSRQGGIPIKTLTGEPIINPNKKFIPVKSICQCRTYEGAYSGGIPRVTPTSASSKKTIKIFNQAKIQQLHQEK